MAIFHGPGWQILRLWQSEALQVCHQGDAGRTKTCILTELLILQIVTLLISTSVMVQHVYRLGCSKTVAW